MSHLRVALIGCGDISTRHVNAFNRQSDRARIVACCDSDPERAARGAALADDAAVQLDYASILADPNVDAVDLCLPHQLHAPMAIQAAQAGKHVLCEKPLALTVGQCDEMIAAAKRAGVVLCHGEPMRCAGVVTRAAKLISEGAIGRMVGLQATCAYWQRAELNTDWRGRKGESGGGHLMDGGIHVVDVLRHLGGDVAAVQAMTAAYRPELGVDSEDLAILNLRYRAGHCGQLFACHATRGRGASPLVTVFGDEGCLSVEAFGPGNGLVLFRPDKEPEVVSPDNGWVDGYERLIGSFVSSVLDGVPLLSTPEDGRENVRLVLAAYASAESGKEMLIVQSS